MDKLASLVFQTSKVRSFDDDDFADRLSSRYTVVLLIVFAMLVSMNQYVRNPIILLGTGALHRGTHPVHDTLLLGQEHLLHALERRSPAGRPTQEAGASVLPVGADHSAPAGRSLLHSLRRVARIEQQGGGGCRQHLGSSSHGVSDGQERLPGEDVGIVVQADGKVLRQQTQQGHVRCRLLPSDRVYQTHLQLVQQEVQ